MNTNKLKDLAATKCCFDFNIALGSNLTEKLECLYVTLFRMKHIAKKKSKANFDTLICSPMVFAMFEVTKGISPANRIISGLEVDGWLYKTWWLLTDYETYEEHHLIMASTINGQISEKSDDLIRISITNLVMSILFGYYNL